MRKIKEEHVAEIVQSWKHGFLNDSAHPISLEDFGEDYQEKGRTKRYLETNSRYRILNGFHRMHAAVEMKLDSYYAEIYNAGSLVSADYALIRANPKLVQMEQMLEQVCNTLRSYFESNEVSVKTAADFLGPMLGKHPKCILRLI
jgi:hypothetical protein